MYHIPIEIKKVEPRMYHISMSRRHKCLMCIYRKYCATEASKRVEHEMYHIPIKIRKIEYEMYHISMSRRHCL